MVSRNSPEGSSLSVKEGGNYAEGVRAYTRRKKGPKMGVGAKTFATLKRKVSGVSYGEDTVVHIFCGHWV